jgi:uncharacterized protein YceH (UPF0502 family)
MCPLATLEELERHLAGLAAKGLVARLAPGPGSRVERWAQRLAPEAEPAGASGAEAPREREPRPPAAPSPVPPVPPLSSGGALAERVAALEAAVAELRRDLARLAGELGAGVE